MADTGLKGKLALVTGASRGIGRAVALALADEGAHVAVNYVSNDKAAAETRAAVEAKGVKCATFKADVSEPDQVDAMIKAIEADMGPVDLLVANAGYAAMEKPAELDLKTWQWMMKVNGDGTFLPVAAVAPGMMERQYGRIVCIVSVAALRPRPVMVSYAASKAAIISFVRSTSEAFAPHVRINSVAPGLIDTDLGDELSEEFRTKMIETTPLKRIGKPEDIADAVVYLLSDRASFSTGQLLVASGGRVTVP